MNDKTFESLYMSTILQKVYDAQKKFDNFNEQRKQKYVGSMKHLEYFATLDSRLKDIGIDPEPSQQAPDFIGEGEFAVFSKSSIPLGEYKFYKYTSSTNTNNYPIYEREFISQEEMEL